MLCSQLLAELTDAAADPKTSAVILRGAGVCFSAGWDLSDAVASDHEGSEDRLRLARSATWIDAIWQFPLPIIAQVHGHCLAGAADLALHCDLLVTGESAQIGYPPVRSLGVPTSHLWLHRAGSQLARMLLFTGDTLSGAEAAAHGLALQCCADDRLDETVLALAERIARCSREVLMANKRVLNYGVELIGRTQLRTFAQTEDVLAHASPSAEAFRRSARAGGLAQAFRERDDPFDRQEEVR